MLSIALDVAHSMKPWEKVLDGMIEVNRTPSPEHQREIEARAVELEDDRY